MPSTATRFEEQLARLEDDKPPAPELLERDERAHFGDPDVTGWCPTCEERAVPMADGSCGWCDTLLEGLAEV
ncbi:MAG TPA: hypothetical protein VMY78_02540 [Solirubrobacteraceae bacterium]|nr:hypothetical protein [Solirubrobacteraceae bacterium]